MGKLEDSHVYNTHENIEEGIPEVVELQFKNQVTQTNYFVYDLNELKQLRDSLISAVDDFKRPPEVVITNNIEDPCGGGGRPVQARGHAQPV